MRVLQKLAKIEQISIFPINFTDLVQVYLNSFFGFCGGQVTICTVYVRA